MRGPNGFGKAATDFFAALEDDNSREFWQANKATFEAEVRAPMAALIAALPERFQPFKVFRMNRDVRFSADKSPYKTMHGAVHGEDGSVHYLHLDADGLLAACGAYLMSSAQLDRYRRAVAEDNSGPELERVLRRVAKAGLEVGAGGAEPLKTAPRGYPRDHPRIALLRQKGTIASATLPGPKLRDGDRVLRSWWTRSPRPTRCTAGWAATSGTTRPLVELKRVPTGTEGGAVPQDLTGPSTPSAGVTARCSRRPPGDSCR